MIVNYLKIAFRSLRKNKGFTLINISGLASGLTIFLLIAFYVTNEFGYDKYNTRSGRIFRVNTDLKLDNTTTLFAIAAPVVGPSLKRNFPEVEKAARLFPEKGNSFKKGDEIVQEDKLAYCDPELFDIFTLPLIEGNASTALNEPGAIIITAHTAEKYFNRTNVLGETLTMVKDNNTSTLYKIAGVMRDIPIQSHFNFDFFLSMKSFPVSNNKNFFALYTFNTYLLLKPNTGYKTLEDKFDSWLRKTIEDYKYFEENGNYLKLSLIPLTDIHLQSNRSDELSPNGSLHYIYIFSAIAVFILIMACFNFMNLSTARFSQRAREVGVRKVLGARRQTLILQFLSESLMITLLAVLIAAAGVWLLLPLFNRLSGKSLSVSSQMITWSVPLMAVITITVGAIAGSYPAFILSSFRPVNVLKGIIPAGINGSRLRNVLVVSQFSISIFLITGTLVIYNQMHYLQNRDLGFDRNQVLVVKNAFVLNNPQTFKEEAKKLTGVMAATVSDFLPTGSNRWHNFGGTNERSSALQTEFWPVDDDYLTTMRMQLILGRNFSKALPTDSSGIIINETAARMFGFSAGALNKKVLYTFRQKQKEFNVIGVVKDFNFNSLRENITPLAMVLSDEPKASLSIRIKTDNLPALITQLKNKWTKLSPNQQMDYSFMDEDFNALYRTEQLMGKLFFIFSILAIAIACLGLLGLTMYATEQRNKEISIRKVLGAGVSSLVIMLSRDFIRLVLISICIATPVALLAMTRWLEEFAYRQYIPWWVFVSACAAAIFIALITVSIQAFKAAMTNPARNLKQDG